MDTFFKGSFCNFCLVKLYNYWLKILEVVKSSGDGRKKIKVSDSPTQSLFSAIVKPNEYSLIHLNAVSSAQLMKTFEGSR